MKKMIIWTFVAALTMLYSCSSENLISVREDETVPFTVSQGHFVSLDTLSTRTTESGITTTFTSGDAIGIYVVNGSTVTNVNLKYTYNGTSWSNDTYGSNVPLIPGGKYFAYYPYNSSYNATSVTASTTAGTAFFSSIISGWTPNTDQSTLAKYTAQDLMVSLGTLSSSGYSFVMDHQMALVEADLAQVRYHFYNSTTTQDLYKFNTYSPYNISDGTYRLLIKPATSYTIQGSVYNPVGSSLGSWTFSTGTTVTIGKYKKFFLTGASSASLTSTTVSPAVGDLYYNDGTYGPTYNTNKTPIGVVVSTNNSYCEPTNYGHGLVMALTDASTGCYWGDKNTDESLDDKSTLAKYYGDVSGLTNTQTIANAHSTTLAANANTGTSYPAFYYAYVGYKATVKAPDASSGWFLPSIGQWWVAMEESEAKCGYTAGLLNQHSTTSTYSYDDRTEQTQAYISLNKLMSDYGSSLTKTALFIARYWSSSEGSSSGACYVCFSDPDGLLAYSYKLNDWYVRPFLAF